MNGLAAFFSAILARLNMKSLQFGWSWKIQRTGYKKMVKWFKPGEVTGLSDILIDRLDRMREAAGIPLIITCGLRTIKANDLVEGKPNSAHLSGLAADLACPDSQTRFKLVLAAYQAGFRRIEVASAHIHVDIDETKPQDVMFMGVSK